MTSGRYPGDLPANLGSKFCTVPSEIYVSKGKTNRTHARSPARLLYSQVDLATLCCAGIDLQSYCNRGEPTLTCKQVVVATATEIHRTPRRPIRLVHLVEAFPAVDRFSFRHSCDKNVLLLTNMYMPDSGMLRHSFPSLLGKGNDLVCPLRR